MKENEPKSIIDLFDKIKSVKSSNEKILSQHAEKESEFSTIDDFTVTNENEINTSRVQPSSSIFEDINREVNSSFYNTSMLDEEKRYSFLSDIRDKNLRRTSDSDYDPSTLFIPEEEINSLTPFEKQFWMIKKDFFDTVVCFKKGKFYELYEQDAELANRLFDFKVTNRVNMKMAGFPESGYETWAYEFLKHGYKVAKVDQKENMLAKKMREREEDRELNKQGKRTFGSHRKESSKAKIIERELTEIVTPGTIYNHDHLLSPLPFYLAIILNNSECHLQNLAVQCFKDKHFTALLYDASINKAYINSFCDTCDLNTLRTIFVQNEVKELISEEDIKFSTVKSFFIENNEECPYAEKLISEFKRDMIAKGLNSNIINIKECVKTLWNYFVKLRRKNIFSSLELKTLSTENSRTTMVLDASTIENLDILSNNNDHTENFSLIKTVNYCSTPFGTRKLRTWILNPLITLDEIEERRVRVSQLKDIKLLKEKLSSLGDVERVMSKLNNNPKIKDIKRFSESIYIVDEILKITKKFEGKFYQNSFYIKKLNGILETFNRKYEFDSDGCSLIPKTPEDKLNVYRNQLNDCETEIHNYLQVLIKETGLPLKYKSINKDIFQIEVPSNVKMSEQFFLVSSTKTINRFYTGELKKLIQKYSEIEERIFQAEFSFLRRVSAELMEDSMFFNQLVDFIATLDCYLSIYLFNYNNSDFSPPIFTESFKLECDKIVHPIYSSSYVPTDFSPNKFNCSTPNMERTENQKRQKAEFSTTEETNRNTINLITGPNMGGKSTILRALCLNVVLAQTGFNVSCMKMKLPVYDRIFTRIGASDSLIRGESTFYIELSECSYILNNCTDRSFIILDELGRGTSTADGQAIARAVLDFLYEKGSFVLFSTHYHDLVRCYDKSNKYYFKTIIEDDNVIFLYKIEEGVCDDSHGISVAKMAGLPKKFIKRVEEIKCNLLQEN